jgi:hypothetical protein
VRALNYVQLEAIAKSDVDYIMWKGEYPETYRLIKRARVKLVFKRNLFRYLQVQLTKVPPSTSGKATKASIVTPFTGMVYGVRCMVYGERSMRYEVWRMI